MEYSLMIFLFIAFQIISSFVSKLHSFFVSSTMLISLFHFNFTTELEISFVRNFDKS